MVRVAALACAALLVACDRAPIWAGDATLGTTPFVLTPRVPLRAPGPTHELCLAPADTGVHPAEGAEALELPGRQRVRVRLMLIAPGGARDSLYRRLPFNWVVTVGADGRRDSVPEPPQPPSVAEFRPGELCFWTHDYGQTPAPEFASVELTADRPLRIREVRWWSGRRAALP